ncbi:MAG: hypothetical protein ABIP20_05220, partial [Chthoniobacteraceae bacterium]
MKRKFILSNNKMKRKRLAAGSNRGGKALAGSISGFRRVLAVSALAAMAVGKADAVTYYWDAIHAPIPVFPFVGPPSTLGGGSGTWDSGTTQSWYPGVGAVDVLWNNSLVIDAIFANFGGAVSVDDDVKVGSMTISAASYNFGGVGSIELVGGSNTIRVVNSTAGSTNIARISTFLKGTSGFTKAGAGILRIEEDMSGVGGIDGGITISGGTLVLDSSNKDIILKTSNTLRFTNTSEFQFVASGTQGSLGQSMALSTLTFAGGEGTVHSVAGSGIQSAVMTFSSLAPRVAGATGNFVQDSLPTTFGIMAGGGAVTTVIMPDSQASTFVVGQSITGPNIVPGSKVASITSILDVNLSGTGSSAVTLVGPTATPNTYVATVGSGATTVTLSSAQAQTLLPGSAVSSTTPGAIASGTMIVSINADTGVVTLSKPTTGATGTVTFTSASAAPVPRSYT